ncbi:MAG: hypothetical protein EXS03_06310 [Phycisphaerales bacterium]|nr:hypothetical protein [Phycisphaerales bacterium]
MQSAAFAFVPLVIRAGQARREQRVLRQFAVRAGLALAVLLVVINATPLADIWFGPMAGLAPTSQSLAVTALWWLAPLPFLSFLGAYSQGRLIASGHTKAVSHAVIAGLVAMVAVIATGIAGGWWAGVEVAAAATTIGTATQTIWLTQFMRRGLPSMARADGWGLARE